MAEPRFGAADARVGQTPASGIEAVWDNGTVVISGAALPELLAVVPVDALHLGADLIPTAGTWARGGDDVARFVPRFAAAPGTVYAVVGRQDARGGWSEQARVCVPASRIVPSTVVEVIDPGCEQVPANLLRFSVTFSAVMEEGSVAGRVHLRDVSGTDLPGTLFEMPSELWDRDRRRLTVLLEPGRIKRGLQPNVQAGPPLREGMTVTLVLDPGIRDADGAELVVGAQRSYRIGAAVRSRVDPARWDVRWDVRWPDTQHDRLVVRFDRPLDRALVRRCLRLIDRHGHPVRGRASLDTVSSEWVFAPEVGVVNDGRWSLQIDTRLEDLAGNSVRRVFDRNLERSGDDGIDASTLILTPNGHIQHLVRKNGD